MAGLDGKIQLAMLTRIPSSRAPLEPDSPQNIARFESALSTIRKSLPPAAPPVRFAAETSGTLRALPQGEELLWGVLGSLDDAIVIVYERSGQSLLTWESKSLQRSYAAEVGPGESVCTVLAQKVGVLLAKSIADVHDSARIQRLEVPCALGAVQLIFSVTLSPVHHEKGRVLGVSAFVQDVTEQRRNEELLRHSEARLREHNRVFLELLTAKSSFLSDLSSTLRRVTEAAARTLLVGRVGIWFYDSGHSVLRCADLFDRLTGAHGHGMSLSAEEHPAYFAALAERRTLAATYAHSDARTACLASSPVSAGVGSMLDVPIWVHGEMVGVMSHAHLGAPRTWSADEENFACSLSTFVALAREMERA